ncbi:L-ribulokinase [Thermoanaerobacter mathranii subsp. mathranii str. A3]|uniref:Ribulokinase n=2 Tax=Thermoanaerobacter mathranii subsp. mathranii TaxID=57481 RepID=Q70G55_9THEO|nr:ribulokinase [Thermoanaerobacter mathranii]ADH61391.1 L-ribulokinase [Thermoanaerobacter mathranii subsp. mathranii str. A3]CAE46770.1 L-ribulokinase [Thermoanaerobacter mathranii]
MAKYSIGIDYGTESARALLLNLETGEEVATSVMNYPHGVMDEELPDGTKLPQDWALQHPDDYIEVLKKIVPDVINQAGIDKADVIGLGIDFTACTMLPIKKDGTPLCDIPQYKSNPHSYVKLWKHHAAQPEANKLNEIASQRGEDFLARYGGKISSEWLIPKIWQILNEAPDIYEEADKFIEATDWVVMKLTGNERRNSCTAGYKAIWHKRKGYPSKDFFRALDERLENLVEEKLSKDIYPLGTKAGELTPEMAKIMGLNPGVAVAVGNVDAHVSVPAVGVTSPGKMVMVMGTSICHLVLDDKEVEVPGMCGVVEDGIIPGFYGYEAGQSAVGDIFAWFVDNCVPYEYKIEAEKRGISIHELLTEKAAKLKPGESGLLAIDWWNGNRSVLVDADLTGVILGMTLTTKPEEIYRALIEATAFGTRMIIDTFNQNGVSISELYACGGLPEKNPMLMQIYADVTNLEIKVSKSSQTPALGAAMFGAVAAGKAKGGFDSIFEAARVIPKLKEETYNPIPENVEIYDKLFEEYKLLHDYFGRGINNVMKRLKALKEGVSNVREA